MRRLVIVPAGVLLGFAAGCAVLVLALLVESLAMPGEAGLALFNVAALILASLQDGAAGHLLGAGVRAVWLAFVCTCLLPVAVVALVAEMARLRSLVFVAGATGALTAAVPAVVRGAMGATDGALSAGDAHVTAILFLTGVAAGAVYWAVAGRAGAQTPQP